MLNWAEFGVLLFNVPWAVINGYNFYPLARNSVKKEETYAGGDCLSTDSRISILLPAYHETTTLKRCVKSLYDADYPRDNLEVVLLTEKDDPKTGAVAKRLKAKYSSIKHVVVEDTDEPKTKPRALNQGLKHASGNVVGIIDAEDIIDPYLFQRVSYKIEEENFDVIQGILDMVNDYDGWKNTQFRGEYGWWFRRHLPALSNCNFPVPLGGTTNFFRREVLEEIGGWDSSNVTEDFKIGLELYNKGKSVGVTSPLTKRERVLCDDRYKVGTFESVTQEESPRTFKGWFRQRTRWQKGKMQTLGHYSDNPPEGFKKRFHTFMTCASPHMGWINPIGVGVGIGAFVYGMTTQDEMAAPILGLSYLNLAAVGGYMYMQAKGYLEATKGEVVENRAWKAATNAVTLPAYWVLQWGADLRATYQLINERIKEKKTVWEKTRHEGRHFEENKYK